MKSDSKSGLTIKQVISILSLFIIFATSTQISIFSKEEKINNTQEIQEAKEVEENILEQETKLISSIQRNNLTTNRGNVVRQKKDTQKYITIEEVKISKDMDLTVRCGISREDFITLMKNLKVDRSGFFYENSGTIYDLCEKYELNEIFFCGLIAGESGWNIANNHRNKCNYISMMSKGKLINYNSPEEGLEAAAKLLHNSYLTEGGSYYYGKTLSCVQKRFCPNSSTWVGLIYGCMKQIIK